MLAFLLPFASIDEVVLSGLDILLALLGLFMNRNNILLLFGHHIAKLPEEGGDLHHLVLDLMHILQLVLQRRCEVGRFSLQVFDVGLLLGG